MKSLNPLLPTHTTPLFFHTLLATPVIFPKFNHNLLLIQSFLLLIRLNPHQFAFYSEFILKLFFIE